MPKPIIKKRMLIPYATSDENDDDLSNTQSNPKKSKKTDEVNAQNFDLTTEAEEFDEDIDTDDEANLVIDEGSNSCDSITIKSEVNDDTKECNKNVADESQTSTSEITKAIKKKSLPKNKTKQLPKTVKEVVKQCKINSETVFEELDTLLRFHRLNHADRVLAVEVRNYWGRITSIPHKLSYIDSQIQRVLNEWKSWSMVSKIRGTPLLYKCYICSIAWWYLHDFREHLVAAHDTPDLQCFMESQNNEFYVAAFFGKTVKMSCNFVVDSNCWRCGKDYNFHKAVFPRAFYICLYCHERLPTCTAHIDHLGTCVDYRKVLRSKKENMSNSDNKLEFYRCFICKIIVTTKEILHKHYIHYHTVRSDLPIQLSNMKQCTYCSQYYFLTLPMLHSCPIRNEKRNILCFHCIQRFPSKVMREIHQKHYDYEYECRICSEKLPSKCLEMKHIVSSHSTNFKLLYKCITCEENLFLLDEPSMKNHTTLWHKKKSDNKRSFVELVVPARCVNSKVVELLDVVPSVDDDGKVELVLEPRKNGALEISEEEINLNDSKKLKELIPLKEKIPVIDGVLKQKCDDEDVPVKIVEDEYFDIFSENNDADVESNVSDSFPKILSVYSHKESENNTKSKDSGGQNNDENTVNVNKESLKTVEVEIKVEKDDEIEESIEEVDYIFNRVIKQEPLIEDSVNTVENDDYATLLCKVFGGSHSVNTQEINVKAEPIEEEFFEDDIIVLARNANIETECNEGLTKEFVDFPELFTEPSTSNKTNKVKHKKRKQSDVDNQTISKDKYKCTKCGIEYDSIEEYAWHFTTHGYDENYCPACEMVWTKKANFAIHIQMHVRNCFCKTQSENNSEESVKDGRDLLYTCNECKQNVDVALLFAHWENHLNLEKSGTFANFNEDELKTSISKKMLKKIKERLFASKVAFHRLSRECCLCDRVFCRKNDHKRHLIEHLLLDSLRRHEEHKGLQCQFCGKIIEKSDYFRQHMRDHASLPIIKCTICGKTFSDSSNFSKHRKTHNFNFHECDICPKKFHSKNMLEKHKEIHKKTKPVTCTCCDRTFFEETAYKRHMRSINGKYMHKCPICATPFSALKLKWEHMWTVHKIRKHQADCPVCHMSFRRYQDVKIHMKEKHNRKLSYVHKKLVKIVNLGGDNGMVESDTVNTADEETYILFDDNDDDNNKDDDKNEDDDSDNDKNEDDDGDNDNNEDNDGDIDNNEDKDGDKNEDDEDEDDDDENDKDYKPK